MRILFETNVDGIKGFVLVLTQIGCPRKSAVKRGAVVLLTLQ